MCTLLYPAGVVSSKYKHKISPTQRRPSASIDSPQAPTITVQLPAHARVVHTTLARLRRCHQQLHLFLLVQGLQQPSQAKFQKLVHSRSFEFGPWATEAKHFPNKFDRLSAKGCFLCTFRTPGAWFLFSLGPYFSTNSWGMHSNIKNLVVEQSFIVEICRFTMSRKTRVWENGLRFGDVVEMYVDHSVAYCHLCIQVTPEKRIFMQAQPVRTLRVDLNWTGVAQPRPYSTTSKCQALLSLWARPC